MNCPLCAGESTRELECFPTVDVVSEYRRQLGVDVTGEFKGVAAETRLFRCGECGLEFFDPSVAGSGRFYADVSATQGYYPEVRWEFARVAEMIAEDAEVLDVGCGDGDFLKSLSNRKKLGLDLNPAALEKAKDYDFPVRGETLAQQTDASADAITLFHVMEHLNDPAEILADLVRVLRPGGLLAIAVPNNDGFIGRMVHAPLNGPPHHVLRWGGDSLRKIADLHSVTLEKIECEPVWPDQMLIFRRAAYANFFAKLLGASGKRYAVTKANVLARKIATALAFARGWLGNSPPKDAEGHSIVAYFRKSK